MHNGETRTWQAFNDVQHRDMVANYRYPIAELRYLVSLYLCKIYTYGTSRYGTIINVYVYRVSIDKQ